MSILSTYDQSTAVEIPGDRPTFYLAYLNRSRLDALRRGGLVARLLRRKLPDEMMKSMTERITSVREDTERLWTARDASTD